MKATEPKVKRMNLNLDIQLHDAFKAATAARGEQMTTVLTAFIEQYVTKYMPSALKQKGRKA